MCSLQAPNNETSLWTPTFKTISQNISYSHNSVKLFYFRDMKLTNCKFLGNRNIIHERNFAQVQT